MAIKQKLDNLKTLILKMSDTVSKNILKALNHYLNQEELEQINDDEIDHFEHIIEEHCISLLITERPYARDLKEVTGILKMVSDIERIGDHALDIVEFSDKITTRFDYFKEDIKKLTDLILSMNKEAILSFVDKDIKKAENVIKKDDEVDSLYIDILNKITNFSSPNQEYLSFAIYTTLVVKYLERIADHSTNIAEWVIYINSGYYKDGMLI